MTPGFISDIVGVFFLLPPTRAISRRLLRRFTVGRFTVLGFPGRGPVGGGPSGFDGFGGSGGGAARGYDYDVEAEEVSTNGKGAGNRLPRSDEER